MKKKVWIVFGLIGLAVAWHAFRPELLFVDKSVSESLPASTVTANAVGPAATPKPVLQVNSRVTHTKLKATPEFMK